MDKFRVRYKLIHSCLDLTSLTNKSHSEQTTEVAYGSGVCSYATVKTRSNLVKLHSPVREAAEKVC
jgi:hypothetical protein